MSGRYKNYKNLDFKVRTEYNINCINNFISQFKCRKKYTKKDLEKSESI